jgi:hypothetical protein
MIIHIFDVIKGSANLYNGISFQRLNVILAAWVRISINSPIMRNPLGFILDENSQCNFCSQKPSKSNLEQSHCLRGIILVKCETVVNASRKDE